MIYIRFTAVMYACSEMIAIATCRKDVFPGNVDISVR